VKKISFINQKGGSGKTTFSILSCLALASSGRRVLAVDCDPQAGLTNYLSRSEDIRLGLFDIILGSKDYNIINVIRDSLTFDLIPADHRLDKIYATMDPFAFENLFDDLAYDYIIFDTPPTVQGISRAAAMASDNIFVPADISRGTILPTLYTLDSLKQIKKKGKVVFVGYKEPKEESKSFIADISREFFERVKGNYAGTIPRNITMQKLISDDSLKWTQKKKEQLLPILDIIGVK
jgi:chromosome partitioning protein